MSQNMTSLALENSNFQQSFEKDGITVYKTCTHNFRRSWQTIPQYKVYELPIASYTSAGKHDGKN
jgi:hypothetical protein